MDNWQFYRPRREAERMREIFGSPDFSLDREGGYAVWYRGTLDRAELFGRQSCFESLTVRDQLLRHNCPLESHSDCSYVEVEVYISPRFLPVVYSVSDSLMYDSLRKVLTSRCKKLEWNILTLYIAVSTVKTGTTPEAGFSEVLNASIWALEKGDLPIDMAYNALCDDLTELKGRHREKHEQSYWSGAFSEGCGEPTERWDAVCDLRED